MEHGSGTMDGLVAQPSGPAGPLELAIAAGSGGLCFRTGLEAAGRHASLPCVEHELRDSYRRVEGQPCVSGERDAAR